MAVIDKIKQVFSTDKPSTEPTATQSTAPAASSSTATAPAPAASTSSAPVIPESEGIAFDKQDVTVIFVLGGPGAGKGTQCERIVNDYGFKHLSAGDLLRAEQQRQGSQFGAMIKEYITEGKIVPMEVTIKLLENAMRDTMASPPAFAEGSPLAAQWTGGKGRFLIDGFPRKMDQALKFDETVVESSFVLFINTTGQVMLERLLERGKTSGRDDDNKESIVKRFRTFVETSMPVVDHYRQQNKVEEIDSSPTVDQVYAQVRQALDKRLATAAGAAIVA